MDAKALTCSPALSRTLRGVSFLIGTFRKVWEQIRINILMILDVEHVLLRFGILVL